MKQRIYFPIVHTYGTWYGTALEIGVLFNLQIYGDSPGPSLLADTLDTEIPFTGPVIAACADPEREEQGVQTLPPVN